MQVKSFAASRLSFVALLLLLAGACSAAPVPPSATPVSATPEWFGVVLTDAATGETFTMNDFAGKVVLLETMAMWCPNCLFQANEIIKLRRLLGNPADLVSVSLDVDVHEDQASLKKYTEEFGLDWRFAVAPLAVARALGNLYSAEYLNPPLSPMLIIDRRGEVHHLPYGSKSAEMLRDSLQPYLSP